MESQLSEVSSARAEVAELHRLTTQLALLRGLEEATSAHIVADSERVQVAARAQIPMNASAEELKMCRTSRSQRFTSFMAGVIGNPF
jgi:hypothetical protein